MKSVESVVVGIDVGADLLDIHLDGPQIAFRVANTTSGYEELVETVGGREVALVVVEATGGYERGAHLALSGVGWPVAVVNPRRLRDYAKSIGFLEKSDTIDASVASRYGRRESPLVTPPPAASAQELRALVTRRRQLGEMITQETNRRKHPGNGTPQSNDRILKLLRAEQKDMDRLIANHVSADPGLREKVRRLRTVPGIGQTIATILLANLTELGTLSRGEVTKLAGLAPFVRQSGKYVGQRRIGGGRAELRRVLYMAIMVSLRRGYPISEHFHHLKQRGKPGRVAMVACMRKLLVQLNAMIRDEDDWNPRPAVTT